MLPLTSALLAAVCFFIIFMFEQLVVKYCVPVDLLCSVCLEQGDKTEIYSGIQKSCPIELESASGKEFVIHLLMDFIYEEKNYLTEETEQI